MLLCCLFTRVVPSLSLRGWLRHIAVPGQLNGRQPPFLPGRCYFHAPLPCVIYMGCDAQRLTKLADDLVSMRRYMLTALTG